MQKIVDGAGIAHVRPSATRESGLGQLRIARMYQFPGRWCRLTRQGSLTRVYLSGSCTKGTSRRSSWSMVCPVPCSVSRTGEQLAAEHIWQFLRHHPPLLSSRSFVLLGKTVRNPMPFGKCRILGLSFGEQLTAGAAALRFRNVKTILWRGANRDCWQRLTTPSSVSLGMVVETSWVDVDNEDVASDPCCC